MGLDFPVDEALVANLVGKVIGLRNFDHRMIENIICEHISLDIILTGHILKHSQILHPLF